MIGELFGLGASVVIAVAILLLVPRHHSHGWAIALLIVAILGNLGSVIEGVVNYFDPPTLYLDTRDNQLEFNQGPAGDVVAVRVKNPPPSARTSRNNLPWTLPVGNLLLVVMVFVFLRRSASASSSPASDEEKSGSVGPAQSPGK